MALELLAIAALLVAAWPLRPERNEASAPVTRWLLAGTAAFALTAVSIFVIVLLTGPTPADVYDGLVTQAFRVRDVLVTPFPFPPAALDWGVAAVAVAALATRLRSNDAGTPSVWPGVLRVAAGLTILLTVAHVVPFAFEPSSKNPDVLPMLLAWVAAIPPGGAPESGYRRFLRVLLPAMAIAETLQVYPVAGSQMGIAAVTFVPVGALCLGDALVSLRAWATAQGGTVVTRLGTSVSVVAIAVAVLFASDGILRPGVAHVAAYDTQEALPFPGATTLHLPAAEVETFTSLVHLLHRYRCTSFIGYPNVDSLYLWSGIEPPPPDAPGAWMRALDSSRQQRVVDELRASPRPCAIRSESKAEGWLEGDQPPNTPLIRYVLDDFEPVAEVAEYEFALPDARVSGAVASRGS